MHSPNSANSSNSSNSANQRPALQVLPPAALKPNLPPVSPKPTDSPAVTTETVPSPTTETSHSTTNYLWFILVAIIGIGCVRFIPVGSSVSGEAKINSNAIKPYVQSIPLVPPSKDTQQTPTVKVYVSINQGQKIKQLQPEFPGDDHIEVESMFLYQKLQRELEKLIHLEKFF